ncbi:MAG: D-alanine--D-alanine ligase family protein [Oligosphaeraceae bacterium]
MASHSPLPTVLLLCGGKSAEHQVSLISCHSVYQALDRKKYTPVVAGIDEEGVWHFYGDKEFLDNGEDPRRVKLREDAPVCFPMSTPQGAALVFPGSRRKPVPFSLAFPVLHGTYGEDGCIQGMLEMLDVPCVGCGVAASANCMDKERTKVLASSLLNIPVAPFYAFGAGDEIPQEQLIQDLGLPLFVKPACTGSSVGIVRVAKAEELGKALEEAFLYDDKVLVEAAVQNAREVECAVLEMPDGSLMVADPGEVIPRTGFYDYQAKYLDDQGARLQVPARLTQEEREFVREAAGMVFAALECHGMARVDFFLRKDRRKNTRDPLILNEINTIPGFTSISLYPKMMENNGMDYPTLISTLLETAQARFLRKKQLRRSPEA